MWNNLITLLSAIRNKMMLVYYLFFISYEQTIYY